MTIKECYSSKFWKEVEIKVVSAWEPGPTEQVVSIKDGSGQYNVAVKAATEEQFMDTDDEGKSQKCKLRCRGGILEMQILEPAVMGKQKQYRKWKGTRTCQM